VQRRQQRTIVILVVEARPGAGVCVRHAAALQYDGRDGRQQQQTHARMLTHGKANARHGRH
jgi:hypothetical protein